MLDDMEAAVGRFLFGVALLAVAQLAVAEDVIARLAARAGCGTDPRLTVVSAHPRAGRVARVVAAAELQAVGVEVARLSVSDGAGRGKAAELAGVWISIAGLASGGAVLRQRLATRRWRADAGIAGVAGLAARAAALQLLGTRLTDAYRSVAHIGADVWAAASTARLDRTEGLADAEVGRPLVLASEFRSAVGVLAASAAHGPAAPLRALEARALVVEVAALPLRARAGCVDPNYIERSFVQGLCEAE